MRAVLLVLLFVNLAFFAWAHWLAPGDQAALPVSPKVNARPLLLASEAQPETHSTGDRCVTVGPFPTNELAVRARATLTDSGYPSVPREVQTRDVDGFWVFLEAPSTATGEKRLLDRLRRGGVVDAQTVGEGAERRISLGVFSEEARAIAQSERVARLQLLPQIEAREKDTQSIWLDLQLKSDAPLREGQKFKAGESELEFRPCPAPEPPGAGEEPESGAPDGDASPA
ncbi:MAG TPA: hypothetical protein VM146_07540 [Steroidobacteraceae bacterium]|nr:hypothetical protein [Steroidobacteraceae bacterium]